MKFLCGSCRTKYQISEDKVRGKVLTIRCQKCGTKIKVREPAKALAPNEHYVAEVVVEVGETVKRRAVAANAGTRVPTSDLTFERADEAPTRVGIGQGAAPDVEWFTATDGKQQGPFSYSELLRRLGAREILAAHYVWHQNMEAWTRVRDLPELAALLPSELAKKTKTPPPPRPTSEERALGEVVDLAEKRAELERTKKVDLTANPRLKSLIEKQPAENNTTPPPALRPPKAEPTPVAPMPLEAVMLHTTTPVAGGSAANISNFDLAADLFASLPRMETDAQSGQRESTRFFIAAAGVNNRKSRNLLGIILGIGCFVALGTFITAWASGFVSLPIPQSVNPFSSARENDARAALEAEIEDDEDPASVRSLGGDGARKKKKKRMSATTSNANEKTIESPDEPRGSDTPEVFAFDKDTGESKLIGEVPIAKLPESKPGELVQPDHAEIAPNVVAGVVAAHQGSVKSCYEGALRVHQGLGGKVIFELTVRPTGEVVKVRQVSKEHKKSGIGACIADRMKDWRFPAFKGPENALVEANFLLASGS